MTSLFCAKVEVCYRRVLINMDKFIIRNKIPNIQTSNKMEMVAEETKVTVDVHRDFDGNICMMPSLRVHQQKQEISTMAASARKRRYAI